ncbi:MAG: hypothetical protein L0K27_03400 [Corynebacterium nuruki]|nr:hypothetical protein [Corynebacterium nuruki]
MTNDWGRPPEEPEARRTGTGRRALVAGTAVVVIAAAAVGGWFYLRDDGDDGGNAVAEPVFTEQVPATSTGSPTAAENTVTTVTVPAQPETPATPAADPAPRHADTHADTASGRSAGTTCDGRGVLIVNSVMSNSPSFQQEIDTALAEHPGSKALGPGTCPSLRAHADGADVYAVVVDYADDLPGLCAAAAAGGGNARLLNDDTSYSSPC